MRSITIVLNEQENGQTGITVIRNETPYRAAASICQLAAAQLLEAAIRAEMKREEGDDDADTD